MSKVLTFFKVNNIITLLEIKVIIMESLSNVLDILQKDMRTLCAVPLWDDAEEILLS